MTQSARILIIDDLHRMIEEHLKRQEEERKYGEKKVAEFIESRVKELRHASRKR